jgi:methylglutaconyl-CoA hydratase
MINGSLYTQIQNKIATVTFYHPASNSLPGELLDRLTREINELSTNEEVHVIILKSEKDKTFCAGASFNELVSISTFEEGKQFFLGFANVINAMRSCSKLIIGSVHGKAVGGGVGLAAACDYCFATVQASIKLTEFTIGIGPFVIAPVVQRKIGVGALGELTMDASSWQNAYWAKEKGLFAKVYDSVKELDTDVDHLALKLAKYNPEALKEMKKVLWRGTENWEKLLEERAEISGRLVLSDFTRNALQKFKK